MPPHILFDFRNGVVCIAVPAKIGAAVVPAEIAACNAQTAAAVPRMADIPEGAAVGCSDRVQRVAALAGDPEFFVGIAGAARLQRQGIFLSNGGKTAGKFAFLFVVERADLRETRPQIKERFHESEDAAAYMRRDLFRKAVKRLEHALARIVVRKEDGFKSPDDFFFPDNFFKFAERPDTVLMLGDIRLNIAFVCGDRIVKEGPVARGDRAKTAERRRIVFRTEQHGVNFIGLQKIAVYAIGKERIAGIDEPFPEPFEEPIGIMVDNVRSDPCADDHLVPLLCVHLFGIIAHFLPFVKSHPDAAKVPDSRKCGKRDKICQLLTPQKVDNFGQKFAMCTDIG